MQRHRLYRGSMHQHDDGEWYDAWDVESEIERLRDLYRSARRDHYSCDVGAYQHFSIQEWNAATELILKPAAEEGGEDDIH